MIKKENNLKMNSTSMDALKNMLAAVSRKLRKQQRTLDLVVERLEKALEEEDDDSDRGSTPYSPRSPSRSPPGSPGPSSKMQDVICLSDEEPETAERYVFFFFLSLLDLLLLFYILLSGYCLLRDTSFSNTLGFWACLMLIDARNEIHHACINSLVCYRTVQSFSMIS